MTGIASAVQQGLLAQATRLTGVGLSSFQGALTAVVPISWLAPIAPSFQAGSTTPYSLAALVSNYNAGTDTFAWETGYTPPSWLSIDFANLQPSGAQGDSDDISSSPGLKIRVTRSTGGTALSNAFGVTVYVAGSGVATWAWWADYNGVSLSYGYTGYQAYAGQPDIGGTSGEVGAYGNWINTGAIPQNGAEVAARFAEAAAGNAIHPVTQIYACTRLITPEFGGFMELAWDEEKALIAYMPG
ncbi:MAG: hypothetical protein IT349_19310 [Candidatus Eisenbacteria bacterium]|nr:hypothetical protein [Candidatus Eisenbacteria bacterium]